MLYELNFEVTSEGRRIVKKVKVERRGKCRE
jgi:hypothetical protein